MRKKSYTLQHFLAHKRNVKKLLKDTGNLNKAVLYKNFFSHSFLSSDDVKITLLRALELQMHNNIRVWVGDTENKNYKKALFNSFAPLEPNIQEWPQKIFSKEKFCIVLSQAQQFNDSISEKVATFLHPIFVNLGMPLGGVDITFFIGNYGYSPFGIHQDLEEKVVFHFHIGPGCKKIILWEPNVFERLQKDSSSPLTPSSIEKYGKTFSLERNDFFVLPTHKYHIGLSDKFSIGMAVVLSDVTNARLIEEIFNNFTKGEVDKDNIYTLEPLNIEKNPQRNVDNVSKCLYEMNFLKNTLEAKTQDLLLSLLSNGGFNYTSYEQALIEKSSYEDQIRHIQPFKICYIACNKSVINVFVRGHKLKVSNHPYVIKLIERINSGATLCLKKLISEFADGYSEGIVRNLIDAFIEYRGVQLIRNRN